MVTITIPKKLTKGEELIVIPRKEYENLLGSVEKKEYTRLDKDLDRAIAEYRAGKFFGPFDRVKNGIKFLKSQKRSIKKQTRPRNKQLQ